MAEITKYVLVPLDGHEDETEYDTIHQAHEAWHSSEPYAVIERTYTYDDSALVFTSTGHTVWPPPVTSTCRNCGQEIEFDKSNQPAWTHTADSLADCDHAYTDDDDMGSYAEPEDNE